MRITVCRIVLLGFLCISVASCGRIQQPADSVPTSASSSQPDHAKSSEASASETPASETLASAILATPAQEPVPSEKQGKVLAPGEEKVIQTAYALQDAGFPGIFSISMPTGWALYKAGDYNTLAFLMRDGKEPLRQVFCFSEIGLFYVDENQKQTELDYQNNSGKSIQWTDMPVVAPYSGTLFFENFDSIMSTNLARSFLKGGEMPKPAGFDGISIISEQPMDPIYPGVPASLVRALLSSNGQTAEGMFVVSAVGDGLGHATALLVTGISAPTGEFSHVRDQLLEIVRSWTLDDGYVRNGLAALKQNGERLMDISQTLSETSDIITNGWNERNKADDVRIQKTSDQILGVERLYNPETGDVYEVANGFYDYYQTHESEFAVTNLEPIPDSAYGLWEKAPRINNGFINP